MIGAHIFYRSPGGAGKPAAFTARYAGIEPDIGSLNRAAAGNAEQAVAEGPAHASVPVNIPEERAEEIDRFALLDYKAPPKEVGPAKSREDPALEAALGAALGKPRAASPPSSALALAPIAR